MEYKERRIHIFPMILQKFRKIDAPRKKLLKYVNLLELLQIFQPTNFPILVHGHSGPKGHIINNKYNPTVFYGSGIRLFLELNQMPHLAHIQQSPGNESAGL
jgi:hypothetical protein